MTEPGAKLALKDIKIRQDRPGQDTTQVRQFFAEAEKVNLAGHERETAHLFRSNEEAKIFAHKYLINIHGSMMTHIVKAAPVNSNYTLGPALRKAE